MSTISFKKLKEVITSNATSHNSITNKIIDLIKAKDLKSTKAIIYELTRACILKEVNSEIFLGVAEALNKTYSDLLTKYLIECLWMMGLTFEKKFETIDDGIVKEYSNLANILIKKNILSKIKLMEKLEEGSLYNIGLISSVEAFNRKSIRINTKNTFEQKKYNLLREESEGYSKLIFLFTQNDITENNINNFIDKILSLIGFFDLDPNRVLDILLSAFENEYSNLNFLTVIKIFNLKSLPQILGFKFQNLNNTNDTKTNNTSNCDNNDNNLFLITAQLIKHKLLELTDILEHLGPKDEICQEFYDSKISQGKALYTVFLQNKDKEKEKEFSDFMESSKWHDNNQKIMLLEALIKVNSWVNSEIMFSLISSYFDILSSQSLCKTLCEVTNFIIEPIYKTVSFSQLFSPINNTENKDNSNTQKNHFTSDYLISNKSSDNYGLSQIHQVKDLLPTLSKIFNFLTVGLNTDIVLFTKILRIIKSNIKFILSSHESTNLLTDFICKVFLPSLSLIEPNPNMVNELWLIISEFDFQNRYSFYNYWLNTSYYTNPVLYVQLGSITKETNKLCKTLNLTKENIRQNGRKLGFLSNSSPCVVFDIMIRVLISYDNQIPSFINSLSYCSYLSYDVISFIIVKTLNDPSRENLNQSSGDISSWLVNLATLTGAFYKKQYYVELTGLICYLVNMLKSGKTIELVILKELVSKMTGFTTQEEMNESQIHSFGGGNLLFSEAINSGDAKNLKKSRNALYEFFSKANNLSSSQNINQSSYEETMYDKIENINYGNGTNGTNGISGLTKNEKNGNEENSPQLSMISTLIILLSIRKNNILYNGEVKQLKLIGHLYDQAFYSFVQLIDFLSNSLEPSFNYNQFIPKIPLERLVLNYKCMPEVIFFMIRSSIKPLYELSQTEYSNYKNQFVNVFEAHHAITFKEAEKGFSSEYFDEKAFFSEVNKPIWKYISTELYFIVWALKLKDIYVPTARYESEVDKLNKLISSLNEENKVASDSTVSKNKKEIDKIKDSIEKLNNELIQQKKSYDLILNFIENKKTILFGDVPKSNVSEISRYLIQYCIYPRLIFSRVDAIYSAKFLVLLINSKVVNFNIIELFIKIIRFIIPCILCVTEYEAQNIGVFLNEFIKSINQWQEEKYWNSSSDNLSNNHCFSKKLEEFSQIDLNYFKNGNNSLLLKMASNLKDIFKTEDYMTIRNSLIVLNSIINVFPTTKEIADKLVSGISKIKENFLNQYDDLKMMSQRYTDILKGKLDQLPSESDLNFIKDPKDSGRDRDRKDSRRDREKEKEKEKEKELQKDKEKDKKSKEKSSRNDKDSGQKDNKEGSKTPETRKKKSPSHQSYDDYKKDSKKKGGF